VSRLTSNVRRLVLCVLVAHLKIVITRGALHFPRPAAAFRITAASEVVIDPPIAIALFAILISLVAHAFLR
jgi:hypothetical protein